VPKKVGELMGAAPRVVRAPLAEVAPVPPSAIANGRVIAPPVRKVPSCPREM
jgi:hypothetical protein